MPTNIRSVNLSNRNAKVYQKYFKNDKTASFSGWVNKMMDEQFRLDPLEAINRQITEATKILEGLETRRADLIMKMNSPKVRAAEYDAIVGSDA